MDPDASHFKQVTISSQWNLGKKMHSWPFVLIRISSWDGWFWKSSCWLRRQAMQQFWLSIGQTGEHFTFSLWRPVNLHSSRMVWSPFGCLLECVIAWGLPHCSAHGFDIGMTVSCCFHCLLPSDLFISKAFKASGGRDAYADDWSNIHRACLLGCAV